MKEDSRTRPRAVRLPHALRRFSLILERETFHMQVRLPKPAHPFAGISKKAQLRYRVFVRSMEAR
ncbi:hypothetical protein ACFW0P_15455 [Lysobacter soli]|uniref:hypothetical protein n=1 Tax=Lysobacter soli TaxID=453783 RepID=UPI0036B7918C